MPLVQLTNSTDGGVSSYPRSPMNVSYTRQEFVNSDPLLLPFLQTEDEEGAQCYLTSITNAYIEPIVKNIVGYKLGVFLNLPGSSYRHQDAEDLYNEVLLHVITRLRHLKAHGGVVINRFQGYVAVVAFHTCRKYWNCQKHPQLRYIEGQLHRLLNRYEDLTLWHCNGGEWLCGLTIWRQGGVAYMLTEQYRHMLSDPRDYINSSRMSADSEFEVNVELLTEIFMKVGVPLRFSDLVHVVSELCGIPYRATYVKIEERAFEEHGITLQSRTDVAAAIEDRNYLRYIWKEICKLPFAQRTVLLLNLKDPHGTNLIGLIPHTGIATFAEIAALLSISKEEFTKLWVELPLNDAMIAQRLSISRQQVINRRKAARRRLLRRIEKNFCKRCDKEREFTD